jgi:hypothetical protein
LTFDASAAGYGGAATASARWEIRRRRTTASLLGARLQQRLAAEAPAALKVRRSGFAGKYRVHQKPGLARTRADASTVEGASVAAGTTGSLDQPRATFGVRRTERLRLNRLPGPICRSWRARYRSRPPAISASTAGRLHRLHRRWIHAAAQMADAVGDAALFDLTSTMTFADPRPRPRPADASSTDDRDDERWRRHGLRSLDGSFAIEDVHAPFSFTAMRANGHAS